MNDLAFLLNLRAAVHAMLPWVDLPEVLLQWFSWIGANRAFTPVTGGEAHLRPCTSRSLRSTSRTAATTATLLDFAGSKDFCSTELGSSRDAGGMVKLPTICAEHVVYYPAVLVGEAMHGRFYASGTAYKCPWPT
ncbi:hypothetical protein JTP77_021775 [Streptomyces sp. S9]|nr:hypothetical protein [Streptomyces sp. S9]